jgi:hypothetical protein
MGQGMKWKFKDGANNKRKAVLFSNKNKCLVYQLTKVKIKIMIATQITIITHSKTHYKNASVV